MDTNADKDDTDDLLVHQAQSSSLSVSTTSISVTPHASLHGKILMDGHIALHSQQPTTMFTSLGNSFSTAAQVFIAMSNVTLLSCRPSMALSLLGFILSFRVPLQTGPSLFAPCSH